MGRHRWALLWVWLLVCALALVALACSDDAAPDPAAEPQVATQASEERDADQTDAATDSDTQEDVAESSDATPQAADERDDDAQAAQPPQQAKQQQDAYGGAAAPPPRVAEPRAVIADGIPLVPSAAAEGDEYGWSAVIDGDTIAVGAPFHDAVAEDAGAVFIFERQGNEWVETALILPPFGEPLGWFGRWLALDDGRLVIGAPYEDVTPATGGDPLIDTGSAYVYEKIGGVWTRTTTLLPDPLLPGASFGWSVAIDGDRLAVSAWMDTVEDEAAGAVYVYREAKGSWRLEARVVPPDPQPAHQFGRDIDLDENVLVVGAPGSDGEYFDSGAIYVYHQFNFAWNFAGRYRAPDGGEGDSLGTQVEVNLPWIAVGAHAHDEEGWDAGVLYLWRLADTWEYDSRLVPSDLAEGDWFGYSPALDGNVLVVGSPHRADPATGLYRTGAAYVFELVDGAWVERGVIGPADPATAGEKAEFGWAIDVQGGNIVVGSWLADAAAGEDAGTASVFVLDAGAP